jgi:hypothetical protein
VGVTHALCSILDPTRAAPADMSGTRLRKTFALMSDSAALAEQIGPLQPASAVAARIACAALRSSGVAPHLVCDENRFSLWVLLSVLPHAWVDSLLGLAKALTARNHNIKQQQ